MSQALVRALKKGAHLLCAHESVAHVFLCGVQEGEGERGGKKSDCSAFGGARNPVNSFPHLIETLNEELIA